MNKVEAIKFNDDIVKMYEALKINLNVTIYSLS